MAGVDASTSMDINPLLDRMQLRLGMPSITEGEKALLLDILEEAKEIILNIINCEELPEGLKSSQLSLAINIYNKLGIEGQKSHSEGKVSRSFDDDVPKSLLKKLIPYRKLPNQ